MKRITLLEVNTPLGVFALYASDRGIIRVFLPGTPHCEWQSHQNLYIMTKDEDCLNLAKSAASQISEYTQNQRETIDIKLDLTLQTPFQRDIYNAARSIPYGQTRSYANLAALGGHPGKARAVGGALGRNPFPVVVPCHRIISTSGRLGGWSGPSGFKEILLKHEQYSQ